MQCAITCSDMFPGFSSGKKPASEGRLKQSERYFDHINGREKHKFGCCRTLASRDENKYCREQDL